MMKHFGFSIAFTIVCLGLSAYWGYTHGPEAGLKTMFTALTITAILAIMEVSLSFDNAVVNASVLRGWDHFWKMLFLTVGILIAVFGMRLIFPVVIVAVTADMGMMEVVQLALNNPKEYSAKLMAHHPEIAAFGGAFLLMVFLNFFLDDEKDTHWFRWIERRLSNLASVPAMSVFIALVALLIMAANVVEDKRLVVTMAGIWGIVIYIGVQVLSHLLGGEPEVDENGNAIRHDESGVPTGVVKAGIAGDFRAVDDHLSGRKRPPGCLYLSGTWCALCDWCTGLYHDCQRNRFTCPGSGHRPDWCGLYCLGGICLNSI